MFVSKFQFCKCTYIFVLFVLQPYVGKPWNSVITFLNTSSSFQVTVFCTVFSGVFCFPFVAAKMLEVIADNLEYNERFPNIAKNQ